MSFGKVDSEPEISFSGLDFRFLCCQVFEIRWLVMKVRLGYSGPIPKRIYFMVEGHFSDFHESRLF